MLLATWGLSENDRIGPMLTNPPFIFVFFLFMGITWAVCGDDKDFDLSNKDLEETSQEGGTTRQNADEAAQYSQPAAAMADAPQ